MKNTLLFVHLGPLQQINLNFHKKLNKLLCHHCGHKSVLDRTCKDKKKCDLIFCGPGIERIFAELKKIYPNLIIKTTKRKGPMPHNGYRAFDNRLMKKKFPNISIIKLSDWLKKKELYKI